LALVRLLLSLALAIVAGAFCLYLIKRDGRYLRFIGQVGKYTIFLLLAVFAFYAIRRGFGGG
jgi:hypothetical protein